MNKLEFTEKLRKGLNGLPQADIERSVEFYGEIIDDKTEDGLSEEEAVAQLGSIESIISQIISETPLTKLVKNKIKQRRSLKVWEIILLALGSPIWLSLIIAVLAVVLSVYVSLWAVVISLWAAVASVAVSSVGGTVSGVIFAVNGHIPSGIAMIGASILLAGISIFMFYGCKAVTKGMLWISKKAAIMTKNLFFKKEAA